MSLKDKINSEMVAAAKAKDALKLGAIRMIKTTLHNREIDAKRELNEAEILQALSAIVKQRKDSIEQFKAGKRQDLVEKEEYELAVVQAFMPQQMSAEEVEAEVVKAISEAGATSVKDMGKVMKVLMPRVAGKADGKLVSDTVKAKLAG
ncbi:MAG TPA: GatB/YqeY domain-containing protein [Syntrophales bacterium]|nr:GatB/YqeY domain-containing protein [Syntrophales bacterium]